MDELKLSTDTPGKPPLSPIPVPGNSKKKSSGCGCVLMGCLGLLLLVVTPFIGGFIYLASLNDSDYGHVAMEVITYPEFAKGFKEGVQESKKMSDEDKKVFIALYDRLIDQYDKLPADKRTTIDKDIVTVIKKAYADPEGFGKTPPPELSEIMTIIGFPGMSGSSPTPSTNTTTTTPGNGDPYDFSVPQPNTQQDNHDTTKPSKYDF